MDSPSVSTSEFIQNTELRLPRSPTSGTSNLVVQLKKSLQEAQSELNQQVFENSELKIYKSKYEDISSEYNTLSTNYESLESGKKFADIEINNLRKETEELSSQLFSEANSMVSEARKEAFMTKKSNDALKNEIGEKDSMIHMLKSQLAELKNMLHTQPDDYVQESNENIEISYFPDESMNNGVSTSLKNLASKNVSTGNLSVNNGKSPQIHQHPFSALNFVYAPTVQLLRYDIKSYDVFYSFGERFYNEFKMGAHKRENGKISFVELKDHKFYRKLLNDDVDPALRLDEAPGVAWLSKKSLITSMLTGRVSIEPISSVNEAYKTDVVLNSVSELAINDTNGPPVAFEDPCALCGENKNDTLDHSRLYVLKVIGTKTVKKRDPNAPPEVETNNSAFSKFVSNNITSGSNADKHTITITKEYIANQYPLCSYCLHRVRSVCELFAFLRGIRSGIWKFDTKLNCQKNWIECVRIRTKVFYSRIGITESAQNLVNNNSFTFSASQVTGMDEEDSSRNSGYFSKYGTRMSSPVMTNFGAINNDSESESSSTKSSGIFGNNRNSLMGSFWGNGSTPTHEKSNEKSGLSKETTPQDVATYSESLKSPVEFEKKLDEVLSDGVNTDTNSVVSDAFVDADHDIAEGKSTTEVAEAKLDDK